MANTPGGGHQPAHSTAQPRAAPAANLAVVAHGLGKTHADARPHRRSQPHQQRGVAVLGGHGGSKQRRQRAHAAVHQPRQPGLDNLHHELSPRLLTLAVPGVFGQVNLRQLAGLGLVALLGGGQVAQQFAGVGVAAAAGRQHVKALVLAFQLLRHLPQPLHIQPGPQPDGLGTDEPLHILAPKQRNMVTEALFIQVNQSAPVFVLLARHVGKQRGGIGKSLPHPLGHIAVHPAVFLLAANRQRQNLALAQAVKLTPVTPEQCSQHG